jgi:hypothetical protein
MIPGKERKATNDERPCPDLAELARRINHEHEQVVGSLQAGLAHAKAAGDLLLEGTTEENIVNKKADLAVSRKERLRTLEDEIRQHCEALAATRVAIGTALKEIRERRTRPSRPCHVLQARLHQQEVQDQELEQEGGGVVGRVGTVGAAIRRDRGIVTGKACALRQAALAALFAVASLSGGTSGEGEGPVSQHQVEGDGAAQSVTPRAARSWASISGSPKKMKGSARKPQSPQRATSIALASSRGLHSQYTTPDQRWIRLGSTAFLP